VRADRLPPDSQRDLPLLVPPDLAVEIVSPWSSEAAVAAKMGYYLDAGVPLTLIVHTQQRLVTAHATGRPPRTFSESDVLDGGDVILGFTLPVADIFQ
jgi:Uma2 family endonuclease